MDKQQIFEKVKAVAVDRLGVAADEVTKDSVFNDDLGADSLDTVELVMELEETFVAKWFGHKTYELLISSINQY